MEQETFGEFEGVFYFTNPTTEEYVHLWNNREYRFPPESTVPLIIMGEPLENIQEIRKLFAKDLAYKRFYGGKRYKELSKMGNGLPPTFTEGVELDAMVDECLKPLPKAKLVVKEGKKDSTKFKATKAIGENDNPNFIFAEENKNPPRLGAMADK